MPSTRSTARKETSRLGDSAEDALGFIIPQVEVSDDDSSREIVAALQYVKGIGPKKAEALFEAGFRTIRDLLFHFPGRYIDARQLVPLKDVREFVSRPVSIRGKVIASNYIPGWNRARATIALQDESGGIINLVFFDYPESRSKSFRKDDEYLIAGYVGIYNGTAQIVQPPYIDRIDKAEELEEGQMVPLYYISNDLRKAGIKDKMYRELVGYLLKKSETEDLFPEILPQAFLEREHFMPRMEALREMHQPSSPDHLDRARFRLKYEEIFFLQLRLGVERKRMRRSARGVVKFDVASMTEALARKSNSQSYASQVLHSLPYVLTNDQLLAVQDILNDMSKAGGRNYPMNRLLQGDVGSGKTIVAALAMLTAVENGYQVALMAPTEILAAQHLQTLTDLFKNTPIAVSLLVGGQAKKQRDGILQAIASGETHIVVGTHALIEKGVQFDRLGLVITDEQHRFGVAQRKALIDKSFEIAEVPDVPDMFRAKETIKRVITPDVLIMTATPIPRTLALTLYGDMDVSTIREMPKGRRPIKTMLKFEHDQSRIYEAARQRILRKGEQIFIVYPLREKSEKVDSEAAERGYEILKAQEFKDFKVGLIHGKLTPQDKQDVMRKFRDKQFDVLVATTVIEVGIDIPNASVIIIQHAERFGLAQLHQLRGRVGRGSADSACVLVASEKFAESSTGNETSDQLEQKSIAMERLETLEKTSDGFELAKADMLLRGTGEVLGLKQSGKVTLHIGNLTTDIAIVEKAYQDTETMLNTDPQISQRQHQSTRAEFLRLYRDAASYLHVG